MKMKHCPACDQTMGHKRNLGIGTILIIILTGGLWLLTIPFYPLRCITCGSTKNLLHKELGK